MTRFRLNSSTKYVAGIWVCGLRFIACRVGDEKSTTVLDGLLYFHCYAKLRLLTMCLRNLRHFHWLVRYTQERHELLFRSFQLSGIHNVTNYLCCAPLYFQRPFEKQLDSLENHLLLSQIYLKTAYHLSLILFRFT